MMISNPQQIQVLLFSLLFGLGLGLFYDCFRVLRLFVRCGSVSVFFQDMIYFLISAVASFVFIFEVNDGTVRLFILLAFFVGGVIWRCTLGRLTLRLLGRVQKSFSGRKQARSTQQKKHSHKKKVRGQHA